jgi:phosphoribosylformylglycinamidine synthase
MDFHATVYVSLKKGYSDPEGETTTKALQGLGYNVSNVRTSKAYEINFEDENREKAKSTVDEICRRLLSNPTKDDYWFELKEEKCSD